MLGHQSSTCQRSVPRLSASTQPCIRRSRGTAARAAADGSNTPQQFGLLAPSQPKTAQGEQLAYYLQMQPQLFRSAVEDQLVRLREEKEKRVAQEPNPLASGELTLYKRMGELRDSEQRASLEDLMYICILEKFHTAGVDMLPRMDGQVLPGPVNLKALTEGLHSKEALELVKEHLNSIMGTSATTQYSSVLLKMSKFQMAQVYAASVMFGYFLRRVNERFQLEKTMGSLPLTPEDAVARLERLFANADTESDDPDSAAGVVVDLDSPEALPSATLAASTSGRGGGGGGSVDGAGGSSVKRAAGGQSALRRYVDQFDQATMLETARIMSAEGGALVERQTHALLGDIKAMTKQIQDVVGKDATSIEEVMKRMAQAVEDDTIETLTMSVATQRRSVLEAVAFGTFLRDVESRIQSEHGGLLTALPPGMGGFGPGGSSFGGPGGGGGSTGDGGGGGGRGGRGRGGPGVRKGGDTLTM